MEAEEFTGLLKEYILYKYLLKEVSVNTESLNELTKLSVRHIVELTAEEGFDLTDTPGCTGMTSYTEKKVLMLLTIKDKLEIAVPAEELVKARTVGDLAACLYPYYIQKGKVREE